MNKLIFSKNVTMSRLLFATSLAALMSVPPVSAFANAEANEPMKRIDLARCDALWLEANPDKAVKISENAAAAYLTDLASANPDGDASIEKDEFYFACGNGQIKSEVSAAQGQQNRATTSGKSDGLPAQIPQDPLKTRHPDKANKASSKNENGSERPTASVNITDPTTQSSTQTSSRVQVETASALIGQPVRNAAGDTMGESEYLLISPTSGQVNFAVVGRGGFLDLGEDLIPVPWSNLEVTPGSGNNSPRVSVAADAPSLAKAPRLKWDQLIALTEPTYVTRVMTYFGESAPANQKESSTPQSNNANANNNENQDQNQTTSNTEETAESNNGSLIVARSFMTVLGPPLTQWRSEIAGADVLDKKGNEVGEISQLVIDTERGQVAYAVLSQGGFLGFRQAIKPVPLQALEWKKQGEFVLDEAAKRLDAVPSLTGETFPTSIKSGDLQRLYGRFGVQPYWAA